MVIWLLDTFISNGKGSALNWATDSPDAVHRLPSTGCLIVVLTAVRGEILIGLLYSLFCDKS